MSGVPSSMGCSGYASVVGTIYGCVGVAVGCLIVAKPSLCHLLLLGEPKASSDKAELAVNQAVGAHIAVVSCAYLHSAHSKTWSLLDALLWGCAATLSPLLFRPASSGWRDCTVGLHALCVLFTVLSTNQKPLTEAPSDR